MAIRPFPLSKILPLLAIASFGACLSGPASVVRDLGQGSDVSNAPVKRGDWLLASVTASFDAKLAVTMPGGARLENDDYAPGNVNVSVVIAESVADGEAFMTVSGVEASARGRYTLQYAALHDGQSLLNQQSDALSETIGGTEGRFVDRYTLPMQRGQFIFSRIQNPASDFVLRAHTPGGKDQSGDDPDMLLIEAEQNGNLELQVSSYALNAGGAYALQTLPAMMARTPVEGRLTDGRTDAITFQAAAGGLYLIRGVSSDFDIKLDVVNKQTNATASNDDNGEGTNSLTAIEMQAGQTMEIKVSSVAGASSGRFQIGILRAGAADARLRSANVSGALEQGDQRVISRFERSYPLQVSGPGILLAEVKSADFDPIVRAIVAGQGHQNDDYNGDEHRSILAINVAQAGPIKLIVTSYKENAGGNYSVSARFFPMSNGPAVPSNWQPPAN
ncbi:MAG: hypothetical protein K1X75_11160 [Leptospirales bacterium]|nr:hypothetical protein [Leptospirales bacterium]